MFLGETCSADEIGSVTSIDSPELLAPDMPLHMLDGPNMSARLGVVGKTQSSWTEVSCGICSRIMDMSNSPSVSLSDKSLRGSVSSLSEDESPAGPGGNSCGHSSGKGGREGCDEGKGAFLVVGG